MITVLITSLNDLRIKATIHSLLNQTLSPDEILIADGGSEKRVLEELEKLKTAHPDLIKIVSLPGSVAKTRKQAVKIAKGNIIACIDTDEVVPENWLKSITAPIIENSADFVGGPTRPINMAKSRIEKYINERDAWFYEKILPENIVMLPMGNSAWKSEIFKCVEFDENLSYGGEDYDINLKATKLGYRGMLVNEAWVYHDQSNLSTLRKYIKKRYNYLKNTAKVYRMHGEIGEKISRSLISNLAFLTPLDLLDLILKPLALVSTYLERKQ